MNERTRNRPFVYPLVALAVFLLPVLVPLARPGLWAAHDTFHHLFRLVDLDIVLRGGTLYARWLPNLGFFYGYPVLNFYAPLVYYLTVFLHWFGPGYILALKLSYALSFLVAALGAYRWARQFWPRQTALWVAIAYTYIPYHLANAYVRGALAEHWAQAIMPWVLVGIGRCTSRRQGAGGGFHGLVPCVSLVVPLWLLLVTHNLSAFLFYPVAFVYALGWGWLLPRETRPRYLVMVGTSFVVAVLLAAFYWLPALAEVSWIRAGQVARSVTGHVTQLATWRSLLSPFPVYRYYPDQGVPFEHPLSWWQVGMVLAAAGVVWWRRRAWTREQRFVLLMSGALLVGAVLLMLDVSAGVWQRVRPLAFLQFPWRLQTVVGLMTAMWAAPLAGAWPAWAARARSRGGHAPWARPLFAAGTVLFLALWVGTGMPRLPAARLTWPDPPVVVEEGDLNFWGMAQYDYINGLFAREHKDPWLMEYLPVTVRVPREEFWLPRQEPAPAAPYVRPSFLAVERACPTEFLLTVEAPAATFVRWHQFWFPGWQAEVDGSPVAVSPSPDLGLVTVPVPAGRHQVRIWFGGTGPRRWGWVLSAVGLMWLAVGLWRGRKVRWALAFALVVVAWIGMWGWQNARRPTCVRPAQTWLTVGRQVGFLGCARVPNVAPAGDVWPTVVYWFAAAPIPEDWKAFVHLLDASGRVVAQHDAYPGENFSPTTRWEVGEVIPDYHTVRLPAGGASPARTRVGMYRFVDGIENLLLRTPDGQEVGTAWEGECP